MIIRRAENKDAKEILRLLNQVREVHAKIRPDIFISGTTKYTEGEVIRLIAKDNRPSYVAADENGNVLGYALCEIKDYSASNHIVPHTEMYIDDICVDSSARRQHIGKALFDYVVGEANRLGCYSITLNVWEGNDSARAFYEKMKMKPKKTEMELLLQG